MIDPATIAAARPRIFEAIGSLVKLRPAGRNQWNGLCCFHKEKSPSFYAFADGHFHCFGCGAHGSAIDFVVRTRKCDFPTAVRELANLPAAAPKPFNSRATAAPAPRSAGPDHETAERVAAILRQCGPITDKTAAHLYLWSRFLPTHQPGLLAHPSLYCHEIGKPLPALVAPLTNSKGEMVACQRIWLSERLEAGTAPDSRAPIQIRKRTLGTMQDAAIRLAPAARRMGIAEGPETAAAASHLYRMPVWASAGGARMGSVWIPPEVEELWVFGDNGSHGRELAERAVEAQSTRSRRCGVIYPDPQFDDFNTMLRATAR